MKRAISLVILLVLVFFVYQISVTFFKQTHQVEYTVRNNEFLFTINEKFDNNKYYFDISVEDYNFYIGQDNDFNKMRKVIEDIEVVKDNNYICIYPIYKYETSSYIVCSDKYQMYTQKALESNSLVKNFATTLINDKKLVASEYSETEKASGKITYYPSAMDEKIVLWTYQGFKLIDNARVANHEFLGFDRYENTLSALVDKYYISPIYNNNRVFEFEEVSVCNVENNDDFIIKLGVNVSNFTYINGIIDGKLYLFDKSNMRQIEMNPKNKTAEIVGNKEKNAIYYDGKWSNRNIYDFSSSELKFKYIDETQLKKLYSYSSIYEDKEHYYLYDNNNFYLVYKNNINKKMLLFSQKNMREIKVKNGNIYYIVDNTIYKYNIDVGSRRILKYSELAYNYKNAYEIY